MFAQRGFEPRRGTSNDPLSETHWVTPGAEGAAMTDLGLTGKRLQFMKLEYTLVLQLSEVYFISISSPFTVELDGKSTRLSPEEDSDHSFEPIREMVGRAIAEAGVHPAGALDVTFEGGARLQVEPDPHYEAWNVSGPNGALVVSMPGGELAMWSASVGAAESPKLPDISSYLHLIDRFVACCITAGGFERRFLAAMKSERRELGEPVYPILQALFEDADAYVDRAELRTGPADLSDERLFGCAIRERDALRAIGYR